MDKELFRRLVIRDLSGELDEQEAQLLSKAIIEDPELMAEHSILAKVWDKSTIYDVEAPSPDINQAWSRFSEQMFSEEATKKPVRKIWTPLMRVAAAIVILVVGYTAWQMVMDEAPRSMLVTNTDEQIQQVTLPDGSVVDLDHGSSLTYQEPFDDRKVKLEGRGFFEVVHRSEDDAFSVHTKETVTTVLGTSFSVASNIDGVEVYVKTGKVAFEKTITGEKVILTPTNVATYDHSSEMILRKKEPVDNILSWQNDILQFENTPLGTIIKDLERHYDVHFEVENERILGCPYKATFENVQLADVLDDLSFGLNLTFSRGNNDTYTITGKGCPN